MANDIRKNMQYFNVITLHLFQKLYDNFPLPLELDYTQTGVDAVMGLEELEDAGEYFNFYAIVPDVISWLAEEGFLRHTPDPNATAVGSWSGKIYGVRLSLKGLTILGSLPTAVMANEPRVRMIDRVRGLLGKGIGAATSEAAKQIVVEYLRLRDVADLNRNDSRRYDGHSNLAVKLRALPSLGYRHAARFCKRHGHHAHQT